MGKLKEGARFASNLTFRTIPLKLAAWELTFGRPEDNGWPGPFKYWFGLGQVAWQSPFQVFNPATSVVLEHELNPNSQLHPIVERDRSLFWKAMGIDLGCSAVAFGVGALVQYTVHQDLVLPALGIAKGALNFIENSAVGMAEYKLRRKLSSHK